MMSVMIGIDEVGRGAWAGPLLVVAYRQRHNLPAGVGDSKALTKKTREVLSRELELYGDRGFGWVAAHEIDTLGLTAAMHLAVTRSLAAITANVDEEIVMDGNMNYCPPEFTRVQVVIKADSSIPAVSAASIIAKVARDKHLVELSIKYPEYAFEKHVGYGTRAHLKALQAYGITPEHRTSYAPVNKLIAKLS